MADDGMRITRDVPAIAQLAEVNHWVVWKSESRPDSAKLTKVPYVVGGRRRASSTNPRTWDTFDACWQSAFVDGVGNGIGFVVTHDCGIVGVDLDDCILDDGSIKPEAQKWVERLDSYTETSPSGRGLRLFVKGELPPGKDGFRAGPVEVYAAKRFLTVTGNHLSGTPDRINDAYEGLKALAQYVQRQQRKSAPNGADGDIIPQINVQITTDRTIPYDTITMLLKDDAFSKIWEKRDKPANDQTHSGYMVSVARRGAIKGLDNQQLADLLITFNRECGREDKSTQRQITRTIALIRATPVDAPEWMQVLAYTAEGKIVRSLANVAMALRLAPEMRGTFRFCEFSRRVIMSRPPPWWNAEWPWVSGEFGPNDDARVTEWMHNRGIMTSHEIAGKTVAMVAEENPFNPVRDYLERLEWDGESRIAGWLVEYLGASSDNEVEIEFGRRWLISAVARIYRPGCKADSMLVLEGSQGIGKSTAMKSLCPNEIWFTDQLPDLHSKDAMIQIQGKWIVEVSELDAFQRAELSRIKAYISRTVDDFRPPYGRGSVRYPRQSVFVGTTNQTGYLGDETGNRRFWTVSCSGMAKLAKLRAIRDQLWAESVVAFKAGDEWWISDATLTGKAEIEQTRRLHAIETWLGVLEEKLIGIKQTKARECLVDHLGFRLENVSKRDEMEVAKCLKKLGFHKAKVDPGRIVWKREDA